MTDGRVSKQQDEQNPSLGPAEKAGEQGARDEGAAFDNAMRKQGWPERMFGDTARLTRHERDIRDAAYTGFCAALASEAPAETPAASEAPAERLVREDKKG